LPAVKDGFLPAAEAASGLRMHTPSTSGASKKDPGLAGAFDARS
jgi:hypothetical protein